MSDPHTLPNMIMSWLDGGKDLRDLNLRFNWQEGSVGAGILLFLRGEL